METSYSIQVFIMLANSETINTMGMESSSIPMEPGTISFKYPIDLRANSRMGRKMG